MVGAPLKYGFLTRFVMRRIVRHEGETPTPRATTSTPDWSAADRFAREFVARTFRGEVQGTSSVG
jgi:menaquinone-dependent protoporphyrinogen IX oxidase